jgi:hypothetical protein
MTEIIVISFEEINAESVINLLLEVKSKSALLNYQIAADMYDNTLLKFHHSKEFLNIIDANFGCSLYFNFSNFNFNGLHLSWLGFQIYKYNGKIDLNIDFKEEYNFTTDFISYLHNWTKVIANYLEAKAYCCGYEPIFDIERRIFDSTLS